LISVLKLFDTETMNPDTVDMTRRTKRRIR
jgi:hypothetical protein